jgi:hypothetical protein
MHLRRTGKIIFFCRIKLTFESLNSLYKYRLPAIVQFQALEYVFEGFFLSFLAQNAVGITTERGRDFRASESIERYASLSFPRKRTCAETVR